MTRICVPGFEYRYLYYRNKCGEVYRTVRTHEKLSPHWRYHQCVTVWIIHMQPERGKIFENLEIWGQILIVCLSVMFRFFLMSDKAFSGLETIRVVRFTWPFAHIKIWSPHTDVTTSVLLYASYTYELTIP
jgi:hypothetical protein